MDREDSGGTASQSHSLPLAARTLVSTPGLPVKVFPLVQSLFLGKKLTCSLLSPDYCEHDPGADWMKGTGVVFVYCLCTFVRKLMLMYTCLCMQGFHYVCGSTTMCVYAFANAHTCWCSLHVQMFCMVSCVAKRRYIIVSCQGDIARELELLTHMDITVCQVTAWTI